MEEGQLPDWLAELRDQQLSGEGPAEPSPLDGGDSLDWLRDVGDPPETSMEQTQVSESPWPETPPVESVDDTVEAPAAAAEELEEPDLLSDLREQVIQSTGELPEYQEPSLLDRVFPFPPHQRLVLAILLCANVGLLGCMLLVASGRLIPLE